MGDESNLLTEMIKALAKNAIVADFGCLHWKVWNTAQNLGRRDLIHLGIDTHHRNDTPPDCYYCPIIPGPTPLAEITARAPDGVDLLVAAHVIEHLPDPVRSFGAWVDITRVNGLIYVEAPSELSANLPSQDDVEQHGFGSFWDDPTHVRPWTPAALYRLGLSWGTYPIRCGRAERDGIPCSVGIFRRIEAKESNYRYVSLQGVPAGVQAAVSHTQYLGR